MNGAMVLAGSLSLVLGAEAGLPTAPVDPTRSGPVPSPIQEAAPPLMDVFGASISVSQNGAAVTTVATPFAYWLPGDAPFADLRVQLDAGGAKERWGGALSVTLLSNIPKKLQLPAKEAEAAVAKCEEKTRGKSRLVRPVVARTKVLIELLPGGKGSPLERAQDETIDAHGGRVVAAWKRYAPTAKDATRGDGVVKELEEALESYRTALGDCALQGLWAGRWERVYDNGYFVRLNVGAHVFPYVRGPAVPVDGTLSAPTPHFNADQTVAVSAAYFPSPIFGLWLTGAYARSRPGSQASGFPERVSAGIDAAWNAHTEDRQQDGFQPGFAVGGYVRVSWCLATQGCGQSLTEYADPIPAASVQTFGAFVDARVTSKIQLRLALPVDHFRLARPIAGSDGKIDVWRVVPTLSLTVASWAI